MRIAGQELALVRDKGQLVGEAVLDGTEGESILLLTPPPLSPHTARGASDHRPLGLAIPLEA